MTQRILALGAMLAWATAASAQTIEFVPRTEFYMSAEYLGSDDHERFQWDANFGGAIDFVDYGRGRATFVANYQVVMGNEFKEFDPNQGNYILEGATSLRAGGVEAALVFHHLSRHLSDRPKRQPVDWNMVGGRVQRAFATGAWRGDARVDLRGVVQRSLVDYRWEAVGGMRSVYTVRPRVGVIADVDVRVLGVDGSQNRGTQAGFRAEGGVRFDGRAGAVELFVAGERRIDPYPLEFGTATWLTAGFRLLSR